MTTARRIRAGLAALAAFVLVLPFAGAASARHDVDVHLHYPPPRRAARERMEYAWRLYEAGELERAESVAGDAGKDALALRPEARFLAARVAYSKGHLDRAADIFGDIRLEFPRSALVRSGRLAAKVEEAADRLMAGMRWHEAGPFLVVLEALDPGALNALALRYETKVRAAVQAFNARLSGETWPVGAAFEAWLASKGGRPERRIGTCRAEDEHCAQGMRERAWTVHQQFEAGEQARWEAEFAALAAELRHEFACSLLAKARDYPLLAGLLCEPVLLRGIGPRVFPAPSSPYSYEVRTERWKRKEGLLRTPYRVDAWKVAGRRFGCPPLAYDCLHFEGLDAALLLQRLGRELYAGTPALEAKEEPF